MIYPTGFTVVLRKGKGLAHGLRLHSHAFVRIVEADEIQSLYRLNPSLRAFAARFNLSWKTAKKILEANKVDFSAQISLEYARGLSLNELSAKHGPKPETFSNWLKQLGVPVKRGNHRRVADIEAFKREFFATSSVNRAAQIAGIHWSTAARLLEENGAMSIPDTEE